MKTCVLYPISKVLEILPGWRLEEIKVSKWAEDEGSWTSDETRLTNQPEILKFSTSYGLGIWDRMTFVDSDGNTKIAESVSYADDHTNPERLKTRDFISPKLLIVEDTYIEKNKYLVDWLTYKCVDIGELDKYSKEIILYETIEYLGISDVVLHEIREGKQYFGYSSNNLILDEREIEFVLNGIADKLLREKIKCILYARVFKRRH